MGEAKYKPMKQHFAATIENGALQIAPFRKWFIAHENDPGRRFLTTHQMRSRMKQRGWVVAESEKRILVAEPTAQPFLAGYTMAELPNLRKKKGRPARITNERKNLTRLAGEFLVASRLTQRGYMVSLQWGATIGYDILVFDKEGRVAFLEVKSGAHTSRRWILQKKYAFPEADKIDVSRRFVCCVDLAQPDKEPDIYVFPVKIIAEGIRYFFSGKYPRSSSFHLSLDFKPQGKTKELGVATVGQKIDCESFREKFSILNVKTINS
jgi:hypothetical protein